MFPAAFLASPTLTKHVLVSARQTASHADLRFLHTDAPCGDTVSSFDMTCRILI